MAGNHLGSPRWKRWEIIGKAFWPTKGVNLQPPRTIFCSAKLWAMIAQAFPLTLNWRVAKLRLHLPPAISPTWTQWQFLMARANCPNPQILTLRTQCGLREPSAAFILNITLH